MRAIPGVCRVSRVQYLRYLHFSSLHFTGKRLGRDLTSLSYLTRGLRGEKPRALAEGMGQEGLRGKWMGRGGHGGITGLQSGLPTSAVPTQ